MELSLARYRLLFIHPFGTAHGLRDGTDTVFVRLTHGCITGYGEATLPPYLEITQQSVFEELKDFNLDHLQYLENGVEPGLSAPARAALSTAYYDLMSKDLGRSASSLIVGLPNTGCDAPTMVTLGHSLLNHISLKLSEMPRSSCLKVKLGSLADKATLKAVKELDQRPLFLDANQGWTSVVQALDAIAIAGEGDVVGLEQPFAKERWDLHAELRNVTAVPIYGDESIQGVADLERATEAFDGVNLKLMKCGGLDSAAAMAKRARELGLKVMLGSMSESSLGCGAMAQLAGSADLLDLDGPWLIKNDPFQGLRMEDGRLLIEGITGVGIELRSGAQLNWIHIGA